MEDELFLYIQDQKEKKSTARSARYRRTHTGKGGRCKLPSDRLTKKEWEQMNGEVKTYKMNSPMKWDEFKEMPDDLKVMYIKAIRAKWNPPDTYLTKIFCVSQQTVSREIVRIGCGVGKTRSGRTHWDKEGFLAWVNGVTVQKKSEEETQESPEVPETPEVPEEVEQVVESTFIEDVEKAMESLEGVVIRENVSEGKILPVNQEEVNVLPVCQKNVKKVIPSCGSMTLQGLTEDVLNTLGVLLGGAEITINIAWETHTEGI
jgi:hypothetical protein